ncbi:MAG: right-handed parallel beta-helix repeat-containing protein [Deltaproteobacteria bacterium]|nr:right-handed parallel beta-helix repeat-containing protein [Deltaproteobacteria bacterium]
MKTLSKFALTLALTACSTGPTPAQDATVEDSPARNDAATRETSAAPEDAQEPSLDAVAEDTATSPDAIAPTDAATSPDAIAPTDAASDAPAAMCTEVVRTAAELIAAAQRLGPGRVVCIAPGRYVLSQRISLGMARSGTAAAPAVIRSQNGRGTVTIDGANNEEAFFLSGASFVQIRGLIITGGQYHGVKIDAPSGDIVVSDCEIVDTFNGTDANSQLSPIKGYQAPRVLIEGNSIHFSRRWIGNNIQGVDCNACPQWTVRDNEIYDIRARAGGTSGTAIQFKSGSSETVIERNVLHDSFIGISFGGFGSPMAWSGQPWEHVAGVVRNNVIYRCEDAGITVIYARDGRIVNNTLWGNGFTPDVRRMAMNVRYQNNILDRALNFRDGTAGGVMAANNLVLASPMESALFVNAARGDFHLAAGASMAINRGMSLASDVPDDMDREARPRGGAFDIGADER